MSENKLEHFPINLFATVMGIGGLALAWRRSAIWFDTDILISQALALTAAALWVVVMATYIAKWVRFPQAAKAEAKNPMSLPFLSTPTISLLILGSAFVSVDANIANVMWWIATIGQLIMTVILLSALVFRKDVKFAQLTPPWFIPIVGNVIAPLAIAHIGSKDVAWFSFGFGAIAWLVLLPLIVRRAFFFKPAIPTPMTPVLTIFMAPPAVIMLSWQSLTGAEIDWLTLTLFAVTIFFMAVLAVRLPELRKAPFGVPYWSYTFPFAAAAAATITMAGMWGQEWALWVAALLLAFTTVLILAIAFKSIPAFRAGKMVVRH